jgi:antitoxin component YwqK of YwqJK toxin-antitoxin module
VLGLFNPVPDVAEKQLQDNIAHNITKCGKENDTKTNTEFPRELNKLISDYSDYEDIKILEKTFNDMKLNPIREEKRVISRYKENEKQRAVGTYIDKVLRFYEIYNSSGKLISRISLNENGQLHGTQYSYYPSNGRVHVKYNYENGKLIGTQYTYDSIGKLTGEYNFKNGLQDGIQKNFYDNSSIEVSKEFKDGFHFGNFRIIKNGKDINKSDILKRHGEYYDILLDNKRKISVSVYYYNLPELYYHITDGNSYESQG